MNVAEIRSSLESYRVFVSEEQAIKIRAYIELLTFWNRRVALTAIRQESEILRFHFGESLFALTACEMKNGRLADVATGAGFPGLAIKILRPDLGVTLIEPNKKKCAFLHEVIRSLGLQDVEVEPASFETSTIQPGSLSYVTSRALAAVPKFLDWAHERLSPSGRLLLWVGKEDSLKLRAMAGWNWGEPTLIPATSRRMILSATRENRS